MDKRGAWASFSSAAVETGGGAGVGGGASLRQPNQPARVRTATSAAANTESVGALLLRATAGALPAAPTFTAYARTGRVMFLRLCSPRSANVTCSLSRTCRYASSARQISPSRREIEW